MYSNTKSTYAKTLTNILGLGIARDSHQEPGLLGCLLDKVYILLSNKQWRLELLT